MNRSVFAGKKILSAVVIHYCAWHLFFLEQTLVKSAIPVTEQGVHLATWTKLIFGKYFSYFSLQNCCWNPRIYLLSSAKF